MKDREIPWCASTTITKPTDEDIKEARHLPYRNLIGVLGFGVHLVKPECRIYLQTLQEHMNGWSMMLFKLALRTTPLPIHVGSFLSGSGRVGSYLNPLRLR